MSKINPFEVAMANNILKDKKEQDKKYMDMCRRILNQYMKHQPDGTIQMRTFPDGDLHISYTSHKNDHRSVDFYDFHDDELLKELEKKLTQHFKNAESNLDLFY